MRLLLVMTLVVTCSTSEEVASRMPVRWEWRRAAASRSTELCAWDDAVET